MSDSPRETRPLTALVDDLKTGTVLCIGDVMLDRFIYGAVDRISPEAPVPVLRIEGEAVMPGGAGNVALNLAGLGAETRFVTVTGDDEAGMELRRQLDTAPRAITHHLIAEAGRETTIKTRFIAGVQQMLRADRETPHALSDEAALIDAVNEQMPGAQVVILSDYGKGVLGDSIIKTTLAAAKKEGATVIVDPKGRDYTRYRGADIITPNRRELTEASAMACADDESIIAAARHIIETCGIGAVLATRSAEGMTFVTASEATHLDAIARDVFDVSGAGDTVVAAMAAGLAAGASPVEAARLANAAAGIVVSKIGTAVVYDTELLSALRHQGVSNAEAKVKSLDTALALIENWRADGMKIGFTNGCFDLLHPGHVSLLAEARGTCDRLVVGLNSDASVKRLKGDSRPVQNEAARAQVLASLGDVDLVVVFSEDTPLELISAIRPDVLVKGADYTVETVVGADIVQGYGGRVHLAGLVDGHSTTNTIERLKT